MSVEWSEPPEDGRAKNRILLTSRLVPLMEQPGRWALLLTTTGTYGRGMASIINNDGWRGLSPKLSLPPGRWEAVSRKIFEGEEAGKIGVWARYLGPDEPAK